MLNENKWQEIKTPTHLKNRTLYAMENIATAKPKSVSFWRVLVISALCLLACACVGYAAQVFLSANEIAEHLKGEEVAEYFKLDAAITTAQTKTDAGYIVTFLGLASGAEIKEFTVAENEQTYAVVAIQKQDGTKMALDGKSRFEVSPVIYGADERVLDIWWMDGHYIEQIIDGTLYRIIACDSIEIFADQEISLCVTGGDAYPSPEDELNVAFDLPLDESLADKVAASAYLEEQKERYKYGASLNRKAIFDEKYGSAQIYAYYTEIEENPEMLSLLDYYEELEKIKTEFFKGIDIEYLQKNAVVVEDSVQTISKDETVLIYNAKEILRVNDEKIWGNNDGICNPQDVMANLLFEENGTKFYISDDDWYTGSMNANNPVYSLSDAIVDVLAVSENKQNTDDIDVKIYRLKFYYYDEEFLFFN